MQEDLQLTLFILGLIAIPAVLLHGLWKIRKSNKQSKKANYESKNWDPSFEHQDEIDDAPMYDEHGVGKARVVINPSPKKQPNFSDKFTDELTQAGSTHKASAEHLDEANEPRVESDKNNPQNNDSNRKETQDEAFIDDDKLNEQFENIAKGIDTSIYGENVVALDKNNSAFQTKPSEAQFDGYDSSEADKYVDDNSDKPVYSNVVTQPKPEFNKPIYGKDSDEDNIVAPTNPPEFLLKKSARTHKETESTDVAKPREEKTSDIRVNIDDIPDFANDPDFSLNIQDGPKSPIKKAPTEKQSAVEKKPEKQLSFTEQAKRFVRRNKKTVAEKIRKEPVLKAKESDDQMRIDFDTDSEDKSDITSQEQTQKSNVETKSSSSNTAIEETDVLVLNVRAADDNPIEGAALLPMLLTLGFKFGEHDIFHRHVNTNGKGPILFSLTNMFKPGVFDIDNMETFKTFGVSLFMMLPIEGDAQQVFNMMHNAARKISDEFDCRILDGNKVGLSKQSLQQYVERIREFERKRKTN